MRSNINALKKKYNINTDRGLLHFLADKELMPPVPELKIKKERVTKVADKPVVVMTEESLKELREMFECKNEQTDILKGDNS